VAAGTGSLLALLVESALVVASLVPVESLVSVEVSLGAVVSSGKVPCTAPEFVLLEVVASVSDVSD